MTQPLFKDIGKRLNDLLTKDFPSDKKEQKAEWKSETPAGVKLEFGVKTEESRDASRTVGTIKNEYLYRPWKTTFTGEVNTDREVKAEASVQDRFVAGLKNTFGIQSQARKNQLDYFSVFGLEYRHDAASATGSADFGRHADNGLKGSVVLGIQGFSVGVNAEYVRNDATQLKELKTVVSYASPEFDVVGFGKVNGSKDSVRKTSELGATYYQRLNSDFAVGTEIKFDVGSKDSEKKPTLAFGASYNQQEAALKVRYDTEGKLGLSYGQQFNKSARLVLSSTINTNDASSGSNFGIGLCLNG